MPRSRVAKVNQSAQSIALGKMLQRLAAENKIGLTYEHKQLENKATSQKQC